MTEAKYPYMPEGREFKFAGLDNVFMQAAMIAQEELSGDPIYPVGVVLVKDGKVIGRGGNGFNMGSGYVHICPRVVLDCKTGEGYDLCRHHDPEGHAEPNAILDAQKNGFNTDGADAYLYGHYWACKPCWDKMITAGIENVYMLEESVDLFSRQAVHGRTLVSSKKTAYMSGGLTLAPEEVRELYDELFAETQEMGIEMYCPHRNSDPQRGTESMNAREVYDLDRKHVLESDVLVAYVGQPSLGTGAEIEIAEAAGKSIILLSEKGSVVSRMTLGSPSVVYHIEFDNISDARRKLRQVLKQL